jgi:hypothetical protein
MLPETIRLADRPLEPKEVDSFPAIVMLSLGDDGKPIFGYQNHMIYCGEYTAMML